MKKFTNNGTFFIFDVNSPKHRSSLDYFSYLYNEDKKERFYKDYKNYHRNKSIKVMQFFLFLFPIKTL